MYVSKETTEQIEKRLLKVLKQAHLTTFSLPYYFMEWPLTDFYMHKEALAFIRDEQVWSALVPQKTEDVEVFSIFCFHFSPGLDNSGFVGWLATKLKKTIGTGVFVLCGQNSGKGGIFDYWGVPWEMKELVFELIKELRES